jgi:hypothetical protein
LRTNASVEVLICLAFSWRPELVCVETGISEVATERNRLKEWKEKRTFFGKALLEGECRVGRGEVALRPSSIACASVTENQPRKGRKGRIEYEQV